MITHNSLTRNTAAYIVNLIISVEQYFLQRAYFNNRSSSEGPCYGEDMVQDSSVGPAIRLFSGGLDIKKAWTATHFCTNNKAPGYRKAMSKIIYTVGKKIKISHNLKSKEIKIMFKSSHSMKKAKN